MPKVIRNHNDPNRAITLDGRLVERQKEIWIPSYNRHIPVLQTSMHFCYRDASHPRGSTLFCTCGSAAVVVGFEAYRKVNSYIGNEVLACLYYIQYQVHADNSHE